MSIPFLKSAAPKLLALVLVALVVAGCSAEAKKSRALERAGKFFGAGDYDKAKIEYLNALQIDPNDARATERMGFMWLEEGAPLRAIPFLAKMRTLEPDNLGAREKLVAALISIGKVIEARKEALAILEKTPTRGEALVALSSTVQNKADFDAANQEMERFADRNTALFHIASANFLLVKGDPAAAMNAVQRAKRVDSKLPAVHSALGAMYFRQNERAKAAEAFKAAADLSPPRAPERLRYAEFLAQTATPQEAIAFLKRVLATAPDFVAAEHDLARQYLNAKNYAEAEALVKDILTRDAANLDAHILRAHLFLAKNELPKAIEELTALRKTYPTLGVVAYHLARMHLAAKQPDQAAAVLTESVMADPEHTEGVLLLAELNARAGKGDQAVGLLMSLLQQRPTLVPAQVQLINVLRSMGRLDDATAVVREQMRMYPGTAQPHLFLGKIQAEQKQFAEARKSYEKALELSPGYVAAINELVDLDLAEKKFAAATARVTALKTKTPASAEVFYLEGKIYVAQQQWDNAEASLQRALDINPSLSPAYDLLLFSLVASGRSQQAIAQLQQNLAKNPQDQRALLLSGMLYGQLENFEKAKDSYEKLLVLAPDSPAALNNLANVYAEQLGRLDDAYALATKARAADPEAPAVADTLGWILFKRQDYDRALVLIKESALKLGDNPEVQYHLGMANGMKGQKDAAIAALRLAANSPANFLGKDEAKRELARLERGEPMTAPKKAEPPKAK